MSFLLSLPFGGNRSDSSLPSLPSLLDGSDLLGGGSIKLPPPPAFAVEKSLISKKLEEAKNNFWLPLNFTLVDFILHCSIIQNGKQ